jgi:hypothetical protein
MIRGYHKDQLWYQYDQTTETFENLKAAKTWIKEKYENHKRSFIYVDDKGGKTKRIGYVIGFRDEEYNEGKWEKSIQQHWISFQEVKDLEI